MHGHICLFWDSQWGAVPPKCLSVSHSLSRQGALFKCLQHSSSFSHQRKMIICHNHLCIADVAVHSRLNKNNSSFSFKIPTLCLRCLRVAVHTRMEA